jgi:hypothetical protein
MSEEIKEGYKVVSNWNRKLLSAITNMDIVEYFVGKRVFHNKSAGPLCVFKELQEAKNYVNRYFGHFKIYKCKYVKSEFTKIWNTSWEDLASAQLPPTTDLASWVELVEEVQR